MAISRYLRLISVLPLALISGACPAEQDAFAPGRVASRTLEHDGRARTYLAYVPSKYDAAKPMPLVFVFHGGGGDGRRMMRQTGFNALAREEGFIAVYPDAIDHHWNDGRGGARFEEHDAEIDDAAFIRSLLDTISSELSVDPGAVFATGVSNGGIFCHRVALELGGRLAAIAPVIGGLAEPLEADFHLDTLMSILIVNGTEDPFVPYDGGEVTPDLFPTLSRGRAEHQRGAVIATLACATLWRAENGIEADGQSEALPDTDAKDGARIERTVWAAAGGNPAVALYKVIGGGHTYPGGSQYLPERIIGKTCGDIDASRVIWEFFDAHRR